MDAPRPISAMRFAVPVAIENTIAVSVGLVFSAVIGGVSKSSLAAMGTPNTLVSFLVAAMSMLTTGAVVMVARAVGAQDAAGASRIIEQSLLLTGLMSLIVTFAFVALAEPVTRLLIPTADEALFRETAVYLRVMMCSYPFLMVYSVEVGVMRAAGNSRLPMAVAVLVYLAQLLSAYLMVSVFKMDMVGAGLAYVICRAVGAAGCTLALNRVSARYRVRWSNLLRPDWAAFREIFRVGLPCTLEQTSIQGGYLVANSLIVGLGTQAASVYQVTNAVNTFSCLPQGICSVVTLTVVSQQIGAHRSADARRSETRIWEICMGLCLVLSVIMALMGEKVTGLFTADPVIAHESAAMVWLMVIYAITGASINTVDPGLKAGGEQRFVMLTSVIGVWLVRLPLTYFLGYTLKMGIFGVLMANNINLAVRMICGLIKRRKGAWIHENL